MKTIIKFLAGSLILSLGTVALALHGGGGGGARGAVFVGHGNWDADERGEWRRGSYPPYWGGYQPYYWGGYPWGWGSTFFMPGYSGSQNYYQGPYGRSIARSSGYYVCYNLAQEWRGRYASGQLRFVNCKTRLAPCRYYGQRAFGYYPTYSLSRSAINRCVQSR